MIFSLSLTHDGLCKESYYRRQGGIMGFHGVVFWSDRLGSEPTGRGLEDFPGQAAIHWEAAPMLAR